MAVKDEDNDYSELIRPQNPEAIMAQNLVVEIRQAVNEAQPKGMLDFFLNLYHF